MPPLPKPILRPTALSNESLKLAGEIADDIFAIGYSGEVHGLAEVRRDRIEVDKKARVRDLSWFGYDWFSERVAQIIEKSRYNLESDGKSDGTDDRLRRFSFSGRPFSNDGMQQIAEDLLETSKECDSAMHEMAGLIIRRAVERIRELEAKVGEQGVDDQSSDDPFGTPVPDPGDSPARGI